MFIFVHRAICVAYAGIVIL